MEATRKTYFSVSLEDKPGTLAHLMADLKQHNTDLEGVWAFGKGKGQSQVILVPKDVGAFKKVGTQLKLTLEEGTCFRLIEKDRPGLLVGDQIGPARWPRLGSHAC